MPDFIEFSRDAPRGGRAEPRFTLQARGLLSFNQATFEALGEPDSVALLYDPEAHVVALRKIERTHDNAHQVRKQQDAKSYVVGAQAFTAFYSIPTPRARRFPGIDYGNGVYGFALQDGEPVRNRRGAQEPGSATTDRWRHTTDGIEVPSLQRISDKSFSHPGYFASGPDKRSSIRVGCLIPCDALGPTPPSSWIRAHFLAFLTSQPVLDLVSLTSHIEFNAGWRSLAGNGRLLLEAAIMTEGQEEAPVASAMLILPEAGRSRFGGDHRFAEFVLHIEPRSEDGGAPQPVDLSTWRDRFVRALAVPEALARFLQHDLELATLVEPAAQFGVWLSSPRTLRDLVDVGELKPLPGSALTNWFMAYAVADPEGALAADVAQDIVEQMCEFTLHLDGWEVAL